MRDGETVAVRGRRDVPPGRPVITDAGVAPVSDRKIQLDFMAPPAQKFKCLRSYNLRS